MKYLDLMATVCKYILSFLDKQHECMYFIYVNAHDYCAWIFKYEIEREIDGKHFTTKWLPLTHQNVAKKKYKINKKSVNSIVQNVVFDRINV